MKKNVLLIPVIFLFCFAYTQPAKTLSLSQAIDMAVQNSKQLQLNSLQKENLSLKSDQLKNSLLPVVGVTSSYTRISENIEPFTITVPNLGEFTLNPVIPNNYYNRLSVQQPVFSGLKNWNTLKAFDQQLAALDMDNEKDKEELEFYVIAAYYNLYKLQATQKLLEENITQSDSRIKDVTNYKNAGLVLNNDVMRAELVKNNLLASQADIQSAIDIATFNLDIYLGLPTDTKLAVQDPNAVNNSTTPLSNLLSQSIENRPEIHAQEFRSKAADYTIKASKSAYMPTVNFAANGYYNNPNQRVFPPEAKFKATWDVGVVLNWNVMQLYTARATIKEAKNQKLQLDKTTDQLKDAVSMEVNANSSALNVALTKVDLAQQAIDQASENQRILQNRFNAQVALLNDLLDADVLLLQAKTNLLNAQADAVIAHYRLLKSLGQLKL